MFVGKKIIIGLVIIIIGLLLATLFWPLTTVKCKTLIDDQEGVGYGSYDDGDEVFLSGTIMKLDYTVIDWLGVRFGVLYLNDGSTDQDLFILVDGDPTEDFKKGDVVFFTAELESYMFGMERWTVDVDDIQHRWVVDIVFYIVIVAGVVLLAYGVYESRS